MAAQAWPALGTTISYSTDGGVTYIALGEVLSINGAGGGEVGERDTTNLGSTVHTNAPTIPDNGEVTFSLNYDPTDTGHIELMTLKNTPLIINWKVAFATTVTHTVAFLGWVKGLDGANAEGVDDNLTMDVTIRVTGVITVV